MMAFRDINQMGDRLNLPKMIAVSCQCNQFVLVTGSTVVILSMRFIHLIEYEYMICTKYTPVSIHIV